MGQLSIRSKIILALLLTVMACLATGGIVGCPSGAKALSESRERQPIAHREGKKRRVESYVGNPLRFTQALLRAGGSPRRRGTTRRREPANCARR
jgi:hypothetical protein